MPPASAPPKSPSTGTQGTSGRAGPMAVAPPAVPSWTEMVPGTTVVALVSASRSTVDWPSRISVVVVLKSQLSVLPLVLRDTLLGTLPAGGLIMPGAVFGG